MFRRRQVAPLPRQPHPIDCALQVTRTEKRVEVGSETKMVPDTTSPAYAQARRVFDTDTLARGLGFDYCYGQQKDAVYIPREVPVETTTHLATLTCRQLNKNNIEAPTGEGSTPTTAAADVGRTVAQLYCRTCPYFGMDPLQAAQYDAAVAQAERSAADERLATELAHQEIAAIHQRLGLPPA